MLLHELCSEIDKAAQLYYGDGQSPISDDEYDALINDLKALDPGNPRITRVGVPYSADEIKTKHPHKIPMGSLNNVDGGISGVTEWMVWVINELKQHGNYPESFIASPKMDGVSMAAHYENGELVRVITRGNGEVGDDVTANAVRWRGLPTVVSTKQDFVVRGEAMLFKADFEELNASGSDFKNPRNACSGIVNRKDGEDNEKIAFVAFNSNAPYVSYGMRLDALSRDGFNVVDHSSHVTPQSVIDYFNRMDEDRSSLPFEIDGVVLTLDNIDGCNALTRDHKDALRPRYAKAIKFDAMSNCTRVTGCNLTVGHQGNLIPTATVDPIKVGGVTVSNVLLNNWNESSEYPSAAHVAVGDVVEIILTGDIIPKISQVLDPIYEDEKGELWLASDIAAFQHDLNGFSRKTIEEPKEFLGYKVTRMNRGSEGAVTYVDLPSDHPIIAKQKIKHYIGSSKKGVGILGVGDALLSALVDPDNGPLVKDPSDLYRLTHQQLANLNIGSDDKPITFGDKRAAALLDQIEKAKTIPVNVFLGSLGIDLLGRRRVEILSNELGMYTIEDWTDVVNLSRIPGDTIRASVQNGILANMTLINKLIDVGVNVTPLRQKTKPVTVVTDTPKDASPEAPVASVNHPLAGLAICFTGTREGLEEAENVGAIIKSGVSKGLDILVQKDPTSVSNKTKKAESYGVKIMGIDAFKAVLNGDRGL